MQPILAGYLLKTTVVRPAGPELRGVEEICSVSSCISSPPECYRDQWAHNDLELFNDEQTAIATASPDVAPGTYDLYAYQLFPRLFTPSGERDLGISDFPLYGGHRVNCSALPEGYQALGYDCVQIEWERSISGFGCSPLSCNGMANQIVVNRYCLIDGLDAAFAAASRFARKQPEPGSYLVVQVWRKHRTLAAP